MIAIVCFFVNHTFSMILISTSLFHEIVQVHTQTKGDSDRLSKWIFESILVSLCVNPIAVPMDTVASKTLRVTDAILCQYMSPSGILLPLLSAAYKASFPLLHALSNDISGGTTAHHTVLGQT